MAAVMEERPVALFGSAGQAVAVAFAMMGQEASDGGPFRAAILRVMESIRLANDEQREWLDQLRGGGSGSVNFSGLTSSEIRAQCAMITQAVRTKLPRPEAAVLLARYSPDVEVRAARAVPSDGPAASHPGRYQFSVERIEGIRVLADWLAPSYPRIGTMALDCLIGRLLKNHARIGISVRDLETAFGASRMTYSRASKKIKDQLRELENMALGRLDPYFREQGVID